LWGQLPSVALADQLKMFDRRARKAQKKGKAAAAELAEIRGKLHALIG
jgi:mRNA interferase MazF